MRAELVDAPESLLEERRRLGIDKIDECWDGEWHLVDLPKRWHGRLNTDLLFALAPLARAVGLEPYGDATGLFGAENTGGCLTRPTPAPKTHPKTGSPRRNW